MGRSLSPIIRRELANLDKDADSRKSAMKALKSYVEDLDEKAIPNFLAQVSETKDTGVVSGEYTISLYEVLARVHGVNIVPQIDNIMATIVKTLSCSAGSFALQQACARVVPAISRYAINPTTPDDKKRHIIHSLCKPLVDSLMGSQESLASGAALCLSALVDTDNWRFASANMVNDVCMRVAGVLEAKPTDPHMALVSALAKRNALIVEDYARLLIQSGLRIMNAGAVDSNSQRRLSAIRMVGYLMKALDPKSVFSELGSIIEELKKCQSDHVGYVQGAATEALHTARRLTVEKRSRFEKELGSVTGSNFGRRDHSGRRYLCDNGNRSPASASAESQTLDSFAEYDSWAESPISTRQESHFLDYDRRSVNRKLWSHENGGVDVSLKDGLFSEVTQGSPISNGLTEHSGQYGNSDYIGCYTDEFAGFLQISPRNGEMRSTTPSPQRSRSQINLDNVKIFTTPRKLIRSLQNSNGVDSDYSERKPRRSPSSIKNEWSPPTKDDQNGPSRDMYYEVEGNENLSGDCEQFQDGSESVSSTEDFPTEANDKLSHGVVPESKTEFQNLDTEKTCWKTAFRLVCGFLIVLVAVFASLLWTENQDEGYYLVPT